MLKPITERGNLYGNNSLVIMEIHQTSCRNDHPDMIKTRDTLAMLRQRLPSLM